MFLVRVHVEWSVLNFREAPINYDTYRRTMTDGSHYSREDISDNYETETDETDPFILANELDKAAKQMNIKANKIINNRKRRRIVKTTPPKTRMTSAKKVAPEIGKATDENELTIVESTPEVSTRELLEIFITMGEEMKSMR